jgi:hypothetical protein
LQEAFCFKQEEKIMEWLLIGALVVSAGFIGLATYCAYQERQEEKANEAAFMKIVGVAEERSPQDDQVHVDDFGNDISRWN